MLKVPVQDCRDTTRRTPLGVRWVIVNKGDEAGTDCRARFVAKDLKVDERSDLFATTPPLEVKNAAVFQHCNE